MFFTYFMYFSIPSPYFDHDAFMHHTMHVLDTPASCNEYDVDISVRPFQISLHLLYVSRRWIVQVVGGLFRYFNVIIVISRFLKRYSKAKRTSLFTSAVNIIRILYSVRTHPGKYFLGGQFSLNFCLHFQADRFKQNNEIFED